MSFLKSGLSLFNRRKITTSLTCLTLVLTAPIMAQARQLTNKELRIGTIQEFENLNPLIANMVVSTYLLAAVDRTGMVFMDHTNQFKPLAAERIPTKENGDLVLFEEGGAQKMKVTWRVRPEAKWGDGKPLTGKDYKFAWQVGSSDNVSVPAKDVYADIEKFEFDAQNPKIFTVTYKKARWDYFRILPNALPEHIEGPVFKKFSDQPQGYDRNSSFASKPSEKGLYTGPYRVSEIKLGSHVELVKNENWWGSTKPSIEKIVLRLIPNSSTLESNLVSGNIDYIMDVGMSLDEGLAFDERVKKENLPYVVTFTDSLIYEHIDLNLDNPLLKSPSTRQALLHAIDREGMTNALFKGKQKVAHHFVHPIDPWFTLDNSVVKTYEYSPRKARRLLTEAGFKKGASGFLELNGQPFRLTFQTTSGNKIRENVQVFIKNQLAQVGIDVEIKNQPAKVFFGETTSQRKFTGMAMYAWTSAPESDPSQGYTTSGIPTKENSWSGQNYTGWSNPKVDKAAADLNRSFTLEERKDHIKTILKEFTNDVPALPLYYRAKLSVVPKALTGVNPTSHLYADTYGIENWKVNSEQLSKK